PGPRTITSTNRDGQERMKFQERTMAEFLSNLGFSIGSSQGKSANQGFLQPRVVDKTGLTGKYTFILEYYSEGGANAVRQLTSQLAVQSSVGNPSPDAPSDPGGGGPNIF